jgi:DNA-binding NtrC family response regulator
MALLRRYAWPGNVREERAVVITEAKEIRPADLPASIRGSDGGAGAGAAGEAPQERPSSGGARGAADAPSSAGEAGIPGATPSSGGAVRVQVQRHEASILREALASADWIQAEAARRLGMSRRTLVRKIRALGLRRDP